MGAEPVDIGFAEVYTALERRVLDCAITSLLPGCNQKWWEIADALFPFPSQWGINFTGVNLKTWERLPADVQKFLEANFRELANGLWDLQGEMDQQALACLTGTGACPHGPAGKMKRVVAAAKDIEVTREGYAKISFPDWLARCKGCGAKYNQVVAPMTGVKAP